MLRQTKIRGFMMLLAVLGTTSLFASQPPVVDLNGPNGAGNDNSVTFYINGGAAPLASADCTVTDPDSTRIALCTITLTNLLDTGAETLAVDTTGLPFAGAYNAGTGVFTLTSIAMARIGDLQNALRILTYNNTSANPTKTDRVITVVARDNNNNNSIARTVTVGFKTADPILNFGSTWKYLDDGSDQGTAWQASAFNDGAWASGAGILGYGDNDVTTVVGFGPNPQLKYTTTYFRTAFTVADPTLYSNLILRYVRDDGIVVYLNGNEISRNNVTATGAIAFDDPALGTVLSERAVIRVTLSATALLTGTNVLAVEIHQDSPDSSDIAMDLALSGTISDTPFPPVAVADFYGTSPNQGLAVAAPGVLGNDTDLNGDSLTAVLETDVSSGTLTLNSNGSFTYAPNTDYTGADSFTYHADDGTGNVSAPIGVTIVVSQLNNNLIAHYSFTEGTGTKAADSSGKANDADLQNGVAWPLGITNNAAGFDGVDDQAAMPNNLIHDQTQITVSLWFKTTVSGVILGYQNDDESQGFVPALYVGTDGRLRGEFWQGARAPITRQAVVNDGNWYHVALVGSVNRQSMYVNGTLVGSLNGTINHLAMSVNQLGAGFITGWPAAPAAGGYRYFTGAIEEVQIFNRPISSTEAAGLAQSLVAATTTTITPDVTTYFSRTAHAVTVSASVASPNGPVTDGRVVFRVQNGATLIGAQVTSSTIATGTVNANYNIPANTAPGTYTLIGNFNGTFVNPLSSDNTHTFTITPAPTVVTAVNKSLSISAIDQNVTLNATITSIGGVVNQGTVQFQLKDGAGNLGTAVTGNVVNGNVSASYTVPGGTPLGTYPIEATYAGTNFAGSVDTAHSVFIVPPTVVTAENAVTAFKSTVQAVTLNATITAGGPVNEGTVTFQVRNGAVNVGTATTSATVANGATSVNYNLPANLAANTYTIIATFSGGPTTGPSVDNTKTLTVSPAATTLVTADAAGEYSTIDQTVVLTAALSSTEGRVNGGTVTFQVKSGQVNVGTAATSGPVALGAASVTYTIPGGTEVGVYTIDGTYSGAGNFAGSTGNGGKLTIGKGFATITWDDPDDINYGDALTNVQLNATADIPGTFEYDPPAGTKLPVGDFQDLTVTFKPTDAAHYDVTEAGVFISVLPGVITVAADNQTRSFNTPDPTFTVKYSGFVNGEDASVISGDPEITTTAVLLSPPGNYPINVDFGTLAADNYTFDFINGALTVVSNPQFSQLSAPTVDFATPSVTLSGKITAGTIGNVTITLGIASKSTVIDATGAFSAVFDTSTLDIGSYDILYNFAGGGGQTPVSANRTMLVVAATPVVTWSNPADIEYGTALGDTQLNASASLVGTFVYNPPPFTVLDAGAHQLNVKFFPSDTIHYVSGSATVSIHVAQAPAPITWPAPADIVYGTALSATQLNATSEISGTFTYDPELGTVLDAGAAQELTVTFEPNDANYETSEVTVNINVLKADQTIDFAAIADQELTNSPYTLSATASSTLAVTFSYVSGPVALNGNSVTFNDIGAVTVRANQDGDDNYNAATPVDRTFNIVIIAPQITSPLTASGTQNSVFNYTITASGTQPITFSASALPNGLSVDSGTGIISGTPTVSGAFQINITATNRTGSDTRVLTVALLSSGGGENHAPHFMSTPSVLPNPGTVNAAIAFSVQAMDADGDSVAVTWDFGDGATAFGQTVSHKYTTPGVFSVRVTAADAAASDYLNLTVVVNAVEIPQDQYKQFTVAKVALKFNFKSANKDSLSISGTIPVSAGFSPNAKTVHFQAGGLTRDFTLSAKGASATFKLSGKMAKDGTFSVTVLKFALSLKNESLFADLQGLGFVNDNTAKGTTVSMPIVFAIDGASYLNNSTIAYTAKRNSSGSGKNLVVKK